MQALIQKIIHYISEYSLTDVTEWVYIQTNGMFVLATVSSAIVKGSL